MSTTPTDATTQKKKKTGRKNRYLRQLPLFGTSASISILFDCVRQREISLRKSFCLSWKSARRKSGSFGLCWEVVGLPNTGSGSRPLLIFAPFRIAFFALFFFFPTTKKTWGLVTSLALPEKWNLQLQFRMSRLSTGKRPLFWTMSRGRFCGMGRRILRSKEFCTWIPPRGRFACFPGLTS